MEKRRNTTYNGIFVLNFEIITFDIGILFSTMFDYDITHLLCKHS